MSVGAIEIGELWMEVRDLEMLQSLKIVRKVSNRDLAKIAGYKSHSYMNKIMKGDATTLNPEPALRLAKFFQVGVEYLFSTEVSTNPAQIEQEQNVKTKKGRAV